VATEEVESLDEVSLEVATQEVESQEVVDLGKAIQSEYGTFGFNNSRNDPIELLFSSELDVFYKINALQTLNPDTIYLNEWSKKRRP
jgi:hypothetical protein